MEKPNKKEVQIAREAKKMTRYEILMKATATKLPRQHSQSLFNLF
jgi:hypothetical protein